ncbi:HPr(Ser) kinase/phosphatase [Candidatus Xianfuyuplasma coldseepsis]|uniref:HPr kinase/phosphorylase n=1 Tax=Candidatus Xianfuyuplasma coldseepsis TaxID=2782163 RepID=A0A7L7KR29_9MOLU|nr:HPr(Ser) kinase/phosphatase [Xianfuyuplasma coldseepsis]QMS84879.1 HPr(Ser) kinase/phosphatase [Xianfuyuplasma coldseepsis]
MGLTVQTVVEEHRLAVISGSEGLLREITKPQVSRPGIELAGLFDFYEHDRVQVFGSKEVAFFGWLNHQDQEIRVDMLFQAQPPMFIFSHNAEVPEVFIRKGNEYQIPIVKSNKKTSALLSNLYQYLSAKLAPRQSLHGTLLDVSGVGVLIRGKSGLGKSEVALELVRRGHQLVADDRVDIYQREIGVIVGEAPELLRRYLEIRGIGIVNVVKMFGAKAYKENKKIMLVIDLEPWDYKQEYDRLGLESHTIRFFDSDVEHIKIPISEGRNVASLVEAASVNARLKFLGENAAQEFSDALDEYLKQKQTE